MLKGDSMTRWIKDGVYHKLENERQKLRMNGGCWSIKLSEIEDSNITKIVYITDNHTYEISKEDALRFGCTKIFQGEAKLVVPCACWKKKDFVEA